MKTIACLLVVAGALVAQGGGPAASPWYGEVSGDDVRVRGGPGDVHVILTELDRGTPVRVVGSEGDWLQVAVPGGLRVYTAEKQDTRTFVRQETPGRGVVLVNDLLIRGSADTDHLPLGKLSPGERIVVLDDLGDWLRIVAPDRIKGWIYARYVTRPAGQAEAGAAFEELHAGERRRMLEAGSASGQLVAQEDAEAERRAEASRVFEDYEAEKRKDAARRDVEGLREALERVRDAAPEGHPDRAEAALLLGTLQEWERLKAAYASLQEKRRKVEADASRRYAEELAAVRRELEERARETAEEEDEARGPYVANGWVRPADAVSGVLPRGSGYALFRDRRHREYILESDRYDLRDYASKLVGILEAEGPQERPGLPVRVLRVVKLEILHGGQ